MKQRITYLLALLFMSIPGVSQTPDMYPPTVPEPVEFTTLNVILYLVIPVLLVIFLIYYRRKKRRK